MGGSKSKKRKTTAESLSEGIETPPTQPEGLTDVGAKRRPWAAIEDEKLKELVGLHGVKNWALIATELHMRNGKQCRERWRNHLRPELNKGDWTVKEDVEIWNRVHQLGTKWAQISEQYMPLRTDNDIKNRWNSIIRKSTHPSGRPWKPSENAVREQVLTAARVAQNQRHDPSALRVRKRERICRLEGTGEIGVSDEELEGDAEPNEAGPHDFDVGDGDFASNLVETESPMPLRKLFGSPPPPGKKSNSVVEPLVPPAISTPSANRTSKAGTSSSPFAQVDDEYEGSTEERSALLGGLVRRQEPDALDNEVDACLLVSSTSKIPKSTPSLLCSPMKSCSPSLKSIPSPARVDTARSNWFDADLDVSLSPLLTPSLRHRQRTRGIESSGPNGRSMILRSSPRSLRLTPPRCSPRLSLLGPSPSR